MLSSIGAYTTYLIDLDGVIYRGEELVPGAKIFVEWLNVNEKKYLYLTNNSFASQSQVSAKLARLGIISNGSHVLGAAQAAVQNIARRSPKATVYVVGEQPLVDLVQEYHLSIAPENAKNADVVLVGLDRAFNYMKLTSATQAVRSGAAFIAINRDALLPVAGGLIPGCGSMVAAIEAASGIKPEVVGKPQPMLLQEALRQLDSQPEEAVMIGDSLDTDIDGGKAAGTHTLLVLSGKESRSSLSKSLTRPDYVYENLAAVMVDITEPGQHRADDGSQ